MKDGILRLAAPVHGKRFVAVFSGKGKFTLGISNATGTHGVRAANF